ncbi:putative transposase [Gordonia sihwensis NBRC 108236]|uniref:Putative transposase n=1 Tax=Gordonia sihwensis NBRC 108236 TaxID=1223544 RepID=L7LQ86_9ACTN|nr:putative transposase [Gordonia sihwensis NBRC 108236]
MAAPRKFDQETRERAVRMYHDRLKENDGESKLGARRHVGALLDINPATLRNWIDAGEAAGASGDAESGSSVSAELKALRKENAELRRANEILKTASAFFAAAEVDRRLR